MKKSVITLLLFVSFASTFGQNKFQERQTTYFVNAAAQEYDLNKKQQKELTELRNTMVTGYMNNQKAFKNGDITTEEKKAKNKNTSQEYHTALAKLTGKTYKEMKNFLDRMRLELKNVK